MSDEISNINEIIDKDDLPSLIDYIKYNKIETIYDVNIELMLVKERKDMIDYIVSNDHYDKSFPIEEYVDLSENMQRYIHNRRYFTYLDHETSIYCDYCNDI